MRARVRGYEERHAALLLRAQGGRRSPQRGRWQAAGGREGAPLQGGSTRAQCGDSTCGHVHDARGHRHGGAHQERVPLALINRADRPADTLQPRAWTAACCVSSPLKPTDPCTMLRFSGRGVDLGFESAHARPLTCQRRLVGMWHTVCEYTPTHRLSPPRYPQVSLRAPSQINPPPPPARCRWMLSVAAAVDRFRISPDKQSATAQLLPRASTRPRRCRGILHTRLHPVCFHTEPSTTFRFSVVPSCPAFVCRA